MEKFKALYKAMYYDLKDAEMIIEYACEIMEEKPEDKPLADELAKYAKFRLDHFMTFHKLFVEHAHKHKEVNEKTVEHCMWKESHEQIQEWYDKIAKKISKYK